VRRERVSRGYLYFQERELLGSSVGRPISDELTKNDLGKRGILSQVFVDTIHQLLMIQTQMLGGVEWH
jgi:hypothetical protein